MTWEGRRLISTAKNGVLVQYSYDDSGLRVSKQDSFGITRYTYDNGKIVHQYTENNNVITNELFFRYDENGAPLSISYNGVEYFYVLNLQGDIIAIIDNTGAVVVEYSYDSWGKLLSTTGSMASTLGTINPLRYRGYYYDTDTGFYYCISRYYDPEVGRWINEDEQINDDLLGFNLFTYCGNNPIVYFDPQGTTYFYSPSNSFVIADPLQMPQVLKQYDLYFSHMYYDESGYLNLAYIGCDRIKNGLFYGTQAGVEVVIKTQVMSAKKWRNYLDKTYKAANDFVSFVNNFANSLAIEPFKACAELLLGSYIPNISFYIDVLITGIGSYKPTNRYIENSIRGIDGNIDIAIIKSMSYRMVTTYYKKKRAITVFDQMYGSYQYSHRYYGPVQTQTFY